MINEHMSVEDLFDAVDAEERATHGRGILDEFDDSNEQLGFRDDDYDDLPDDIDEDFFDD